MLKEMLDDIMNSRGRVVFITGEAGVGKTRLVNELCDYAKEMGILSLRGRCLYKEGGDPYLPFKDAMREYLISRDDNMPLPLGAQMPGASFSGGLVPMGLAAMVGEEKVEEEESEPAITKYDIGRERDRMFEVITSKIIELSKTQPLILFLDDFHNADNATLQLFHYVARNVGNSRVFLMASYRSEEVVEEIGKRNPLTETIQRIRRECAAATISLKRLSFKETRTMLSFIFNVPDFPPGFVDIIYNETEGNPYFIEEVVKSLIDDNIIDLSDKDWRKKVDVSSIKIPPTIRDIISQRIERLGHESIKILQYASVEGPEFTYDVIKECTEMTEESLIDKLDELINKKIIVEDMKEGIDIYRFTHTKIRDVIYERLSRARRRIMHRKVAAALERVYKGKLDDVIYKIAHQFYAANDMEKSAKYLTLAGNKAMMSYAVEEAKNYFTKALDAITKIPESEENRKAEASILMRLADLQYKIGEWDDAIKNFEEAMNLAMELNNRKMKAFCQMRVGEISEKRSVWKSAEKHLTEALRLYGEERDHAGIADVYRALGKMFWRQGRYDEAIECGKKCISTAEEIGDKRLLCMANIDIGNVYNDMGDYQMAREYYERGLEIAKKIDEKLEIARGYNNIGDILMKSGDLDEAIEYFEKSATASKDVRNIRQYGYAIVNIGECYARKGDIDNALEYLDRGSEIFEKLDEKLMLSVILSIKGIAYKNIKEWEQAESAFLESIRIIEETNIPFSIAERYMEFGFMYIEKGDKDEGIKYLKRAENIFENLGAQKYLEKVRKAIKEAVK